MRRWLTAAVAVIAAAAALGVGRWVSGPAPTGAPVAAAAAAVPADTVALGVTVWSRLDRSDEDASLSDLSTRSALASLADEMVDELGWGPRDLAWEAYANTPRGPVSVLRYDRVDAGVVRDGLARVGRRLGDDRWTLAEADVSSDLAQAFGVVQLLPDRGVVVAAATRGPVDAAVAAVDGKRRSLLDVADVAALASVDRGATASLLQRRALVCDSSTLEGSDDELAGVRARLDGVGELADPRWAARTITDGRPRTMAFSTTFSSPAVAREQLAVRAALARPGPFFGRTGTVQESLRSLDADVVGSTVTLRFDLTDQAEAFMTDSGPVLFNGCGVPSPR